VLDDQDDGAVEVRVFQQRGGDEQAAGQSVRCYVVHVSIIGHDGRWRRPDRGAVNHACRCAHRAPLLRARR
jgi:hypothetical protein